MRGENSLNFFAELFLREETYVSRKSKSTWAEEEGERSWFDVKKIVLCDLMAYLRDFFFLPM